MPDPSEQLSHVPPPRAEAPRAHAPTPERGVDGDDRAELLSAWAASADASDELDLALALVAEAGRPATETASRRAGIAYVRGDLDGCMQALAEIDADVVPDAGPRHMDHVVALGVRAARGDAAALGVLLRLGPQMTGSVRGWYLYVLALAAERAGHLGIADDAWRALAVDHGVNTPMVLSRFLAGWIAGRDRTSDTESVSRVMQAAAELRQNAPRPWQDADATVRTADTLLERGDAAGAALLVAAVVRTSPAYAPLTELEARTRPTSLRAPLLVPYLLPLLLAPAGILGIVGGLYLVRYVRRYWRVMPGMSWTDEKAWLGITRLRFNARKQRTTDGEQVRGLVVLLVLIGLIMGVCVVATVGPAFAGVWSDTVAIGFAMVVLVGLPILGGLLGTRILRVREVRAMRRREKKEDRELVEGAANCRCWEVPRLIGPFAVAYTSTHLRPAGRQPLSGQLAGRTVTALECPLSGVRWLATTTESGVSSLLLRGTSMTVPASAPPTHAGTGGYL